MTSPAPQPASIVRSPASGGRAEASSIENGEGRCTPGLACSRAATASACAKSRGAIGKMMAATSRLPDASGMNTDTPATISPTTDTPTKVVRHSVDQC